MKAIISFIVILVCGLTFYFYISPAYSDVMQLIARKNEYQNVLDKSKELKAKRDEILATYNSIPETDLDRLNKIIPQKFSMVSFANELNGMANKYNLSIKSIKSAALGVDAGVVTPMATPTPGATPTTATSPVGQVTYKTTVVSVLMEGQFSAFASLLQDVEYNLRLLDVSNLSIKPVIKASSTDLQYSLDIYVYSLQ